MVRCNAASPVTIPPEAGTPRERSPTSPQEEPGRLPDVFPNMGHYRFYELSPSDHITAGHSIECGSDDEAIARLAHSWNGPPGSRSGRATTASGHLSADARHLWGQLREDWMGHVSR